MIVKTTFTIPVAPVTKKNHGQIITVGGRPRVIPSKQYRDYEKEAVKHCPHMEIDYPVNVKAIFYMKTKRRVDIANLIGALHDTLVAAGTVIDDNNRIIESVDGCRVGYDKENPRTVVVIERSIESERENETRKGEEQHRDRQNGL